MINFCEYFVWFFFFQDLLLVYDVSKMIIFIVFFYVGQDLLFNVIDVEVFIFKISNFVFIQFLFRWNYVDFVFGEDVVKVLYSKFVKILYDFL